MSLRVSLEVSRTPAHNRLQSRIHLGATLASQLLYVLLVQTIGSWRDALLVISVMLLLAWYAMLSLSKAVGQSTAGARHLFQRLELRGHRAFAFAVLVLMGAGALLGLFDPLLALTLTLPFGVALFCTLGVPHWVRKKAQPVLPLGRAYQKQGCRDEQESDCRLQRDGEAGHILDIAGDGAFADTRG